MFIVSFVLIPVVLVYATSTEKTSPAVAGGVVTSTIWLVVRLVALKIKSELDGVNTAEPPPFGKLIEVAIVPPDVGV